MSRARSLSWFAHHEARLAWRDTLAMMTAGRPNREGRVAIWLAAFALALHGVAYLVIRNYVGSANPTRPADPRHRHRHHSPVRIGDAVAGDGKRHPHFLHALRSRTDPQRAGAGGETVRRPHRRDGAVRGAAFHSSDRPLHQCPDLAGRPALAGRLWRADRGFAGHDRARHRHHDQALSTDRPRRTRLVAQIAAAIIGGIFVVGLQIAAMFSSGTLSRAAFLRSPSVLAHVPGEDSIAWWPARAALGDWHSLVWVLGGSLLVFLAVTARYAPRFAGYVLAASSASQTSRQSRPAMSAFVWRRRGGAPPQGTAPDPAGSLADLPIADAAALSVAAGDPALAQLRARRRGDHPGAGADHGGRPARGRPCLADDIRRGRARSGGVRAGRAKPASARQGRSGSAMHRVLSSAHSSRRCC